MTTRALYALMLTLLVPIIAYFFVKNKSSKAVEMPRYFYPDTVVEKIVKGKKTYDTVWHTIGDFSLYNQEGQRISLDNLKNKILVVDLFFTRCPTICPTMTVNMKRLAESMMNRKRIGENISDKVHFLSFSIDPERDSVSRLKMWASRFQINPVNWWLLTGDKKQIYDFALKELKLGLQDGYGIDSNFIHSEKFVLIDSRRHIRGYYNGLDSASLARLSRDIVYLTMEKIPGKKSFLSGKLETLAILFLSTLILLFLFFYFIRKKPSYATPKMEKE
ncbi:MAG: SCO family protein [Chitinophagaceae bacterium]|nr:SCO family protein [Chitinophagaceae bacterium]